MTPRRAKRYINQSSEWIVFAEETKNEKTTFRCLQSSDSAWEILLNLCVTDYAIRETFRNILTTADEHIQNGGADAESE